jgi:N-methylhydantoinase A
MQKQPALPRQTGEAIAVRSTEETCSMPRVRIGIDVGGTFTDLCLFDEETADIAVAKVPSTPADASFGILAGLQTMLERHGTQARDVVYLAHGTTVATNTLIQHTGARTGLLTTRGFRDLLEIGRQTRPDLYDLQVDRPAPLIRRDLRLEVSERIYSDGRILTPLDTDETMAAIATLKAAQVEAVAICFLSAYVSPVHEAQVKAMVAEAFPEAYLSVSHEVLPEFREYERLSTTVVNAYLGPVVNRYMAKLGTRVQQLGIPVAPYITQSNGGIISLDAAQRQPVRTVLSGPSTGVMAAAYLGQQVGYAHVITFDMGGTSTDVSLVESGQPRFTTERDIEQYPVKTPMIDVHAVGAGGGSIAWIDRGGLLKVGPQSAGADPGPVCYDKGGTAVTVTDANVALQILNPRHLLGGDMPVNAQAAHAALVPLAEQLRLEPLEVARGILAVVVANMIRAIQVISVQRGYDPRDFALVAFGGAGPLHASWIARELGIRHILIPERPGLACAFGLLVTDMRSDYTRTKLLPMDGLDAAEINAIFHDLEASAAHWLNTEGIPPARRILHRAVDMRYLGQNYELTVPLPSGTLGPDDLRALLQHFYQTHERTYGYYAADEPTQLVTFRLEALGIVPKAPLPEYPAGPADPATARCDTRQVYLGKADGGFVSCPVYARLGLAPGMRFSGPAIVEQMDTTSLILPGQEVTIDRWGTLVITLVGGTVQHDARS